MEAKTKDLWVFIETNEDGTPMRVGLELLNPGRMMADKQGGKLVGIVVGNNVAPTVEQAGIYLSTSTTPLMPIQRLCTIW